MSSSYAKTCQFFAYLKNVLLFIAYGNLGSVLTTQGRTAEAEIAFEKALKYRPNMADVHYNL